MLFKFFLLISARLIVPASVFLFLVAHSALAAEHAERFLLPAWSYDGETNGQSEWGVLSPHYAACEIGTKQSPVRISYTKTSFKPPLEIAYKPSKAKVVHDGHGLRVEMKSDMSLSSEAHAYTLRHIAFHTPSEHTIGDTFYLLEMQFLHEDEEGHTLITAVFAKIGKENKAIAAILKNAPKEAWDQVEVTFDPRLLLPAGRGYYAYSGSLTTPPCTEGVEWRIFKEPIEISKAQLDAIADRTGRNARIIQPVYMRTIEETLQQQ